MKTIIITGRSQQVNQQASNYLINKGYTVVDTDLIARQVVEPGTVGLNQIKEAFGEKGNSFRWCAQPFSFRRDNI